MKKAGNVLIIIGIILTSLSTIGLVIAGIVFMVLSNPENKQEIMKGIADGTINTSFEGSLSEQADMVLILLKTLGIVFVIASVYLLIDIIVSSLAVKRKTKGLYIAVIVLNVLFFNLLLFLGGIFGLVDDDKQ
ncbi:MAG: hypothetical protein IKP77_03380 [Acholeplasmatales bacterium]|nr:hypothetical protein [Acholeplasmatales bacterium]